MRSRRTKRTASRVSTIKKITEEDRDSQSFDSLPLESDGESGDADQTLESKWLNDPKYLRRHQEMKTESIGEDLDHIKIDIISPKDDKVVDFLGYVADQGGHIEHYYQEILKVDSIKREEEMV